MIGLMEVEREAIDAVATMDIRHVEAVLARDIQYIGVFAQRTVVIP